MEYVAIVLGPNDTLKHLGSCFRGPLATFGPPANGRCELRSSEFASCAAPDEVKGVAEALIREMRPVLALYVGWQPDDVEVADVFLFDDDGKLIRHRISASVKFNVIFGPGLSELGHEEGGESLGARVLRKAAVDASLAEALELVGNRRIGWSTVYDIIEFLGDARGVAAYGFATRTATETVRQTANHYRHLGSRRPFPLPANAPSLEVASTFARGILREWIATRLV